jgi:hypothetical protein
MNHSSFIRYLLFFFVFLFSSYSASCSNKKEFTTPYIEMDEIDSKISNVNTSHDENIKNSLLLSTEQTDMLSLDALEDILKWYNTKILHDLHHPKATEKKNAINVVSNAISLSSSTLFFFIGFDFGKRVFSEAPLDISNAGKALSGFGAYVPMFMLSSTVNRETHNNLLTLTSKEENKICRRAWGKNVLNFFIKTGEFTATTIGAFPFAYLLYKYWAPYLPYGAYPIAGTMLYSKAVIDVRLIDKILNSCLNFVKLPIERTISKKWPKSIRSKIVQMRDRLWKTQSLIAGMTDDQLQQLIAAAYIEDQNLNQGLSPEETFKKLEALCFPERIVSEEIKPVTPSLGGKIFSLIGGGIGLFGASCLQPLAKTSANGLLTSLGINSPIAEDILAWVATATGASFLGWGTGDSTGKFYNTTALFFKGAKSWICREPMDAQLPSLWQPKRLSIAALSSVFSFFAGGMQAELSIRFLGIGTPFKDIALGCTAYARFASVFWAMDSSLVSLLINTKSNKKHILHKSIDTMIALLPYLKEAHITNLHQALSKE